MGLPNGTHYITSNVVGTLSLEGTNGSSVNIPAHLFPDNALDRTLVSLADICNQGCTAILTATDITINNSQGLPILHAPKESTAKLWPVSLLQSKQVVQHDKHQQQQTLVSSRVYATIRHDLNADYVILSHASFGSPPVSTLVRALQRGYLTSYPRLTVQMVNANKPVSAATARGHLYDKEYDPLQSNLNLK